MLRTQSLFLFLWFQRLASSKALEDQWGGRDITFREDRALTVSSIRSSDNCGRKESGKQLWKLHDIWEMLNRSNQERVAHLSSITRYNILCLPLLPYVSSAPQLSSLWKSLNFTEACFHKSLHSSLWCVYSVFSERIAFLIGYLRWRPTLLEPLPCRQATPEGGSKDLLSTPP